MERSSIDRRVARTRALLHETLMSLLLEKDYEAISVGEICAAANVGRSTFYLHYTSKDDLMRAGLDHLRRALVERQRHATHDHIGGRSFGFSLTLFEHGRDHMSLHPTLAGGGAVALAAIREMIADLVRSELAATAGESPAQDMPRELVVQYVVGAFMAVMGYWLGGQTKLSAQEVDAMFRRLTIDGIMPCSPMPSSRNS